MIQDTIREIEQRLRADPAPGPRRDELLALLDQLKAELRSLEATHGDAAHRIARSTARAHDEALSADDAAARATAAERLTESVRDFEATHPELRSVVQAIANALASAGL